MPATLREDVTRIGLFSSTRWTVVREAGDAEASTRQALDSLSELCHIYWRSVYLFLRRNGKSSHDAQDLTQGFFAHLIESRAYAQADKNKGRFRSFLLGTLKHFLANKRDYDAAQKRGGGAFVSPLDEAAISEAERYMARSERWNADRLYDRAWAEALLRQSLERLAKECAFAGKTTLFDALKSHLSPGADKAVSYDEIAAHLRRPAATLRKDVERFRARYGEILREEVRGTLVDSTELDEELRYLCQTLTEP